MKYLLEINLLSPKQQIHHIGTGKSKGTKLKWGFLIYLFKIVRWPAINYLQKKKNVIDTHKIKNKYQITKFLLVCIGNLHFEDPNNLLEGNSYLEETACLQFSLYIHNSFLHSFNLAHLSTNICR